ncbi:putative methyltransferase-domain-containing protein [Powellomyces hirtus]|nr:putative methyltransferase-domain-containing protein [Powellomyces hirtus]
MPKFLRLHLTKAPPRTVAVNAPFTLGISVTDDLASQVYFGSDPIPLERHTTDTGTLKYAIFSISTATTKVKLTLVDAATYTPLPELNIVTSTKPNTRGTVVSIPPTGRGFVAAQVSIVAASKSKPKQQQQQQQQRAVRIVVQVDDKHLLDPSDAEGDGDGDADGTKSEEIVSKDIAAVVGSSGVLKSDAGEFLPWTVYSGIVTVVSTVGESEVDKVQDCQRHFFFSLHPPPTTSTSSLLRIAITEHAHMTFSTGTHTWDCSPVLAHYLATTRTRWLPSTSPVDVIELGAGCGLVGIVAACLGGHVVVTDLDDPADSPLAVNVAAHQHLIQANTGTLSTSRLEWGSLTTTQISTLLLPTLRTTTHRKTLLLAADVLYNIASHDALLATLVSLLAARPGMDVLIAFKKRGAGEERFWEVARECFEVRCVCRMWSVGVWWLSGKTDV